MKTARVITEPIGPVEVLVTAAIVVQSELL
jgi:hypothetical protein